MKKITFIISITMLLLLGSTSYSNAQAYLGKSYKPTEELDTFLTIEDIEKPYEVMGKASVVQGFKSLQKTQEKVINLGKSKGADAVIMILVEEVTGSLQNDFGNVNADKKKTTTINNSSSTTNTKIKKLEATYIKYK